MRTAILPFALSLAVLVPPFMARAELPSGRAKSVHTVLAKVDSGIKPEHYIATEADLDEDGRKDVLVLMKEKADHGGADGCTLFLLRASKEDPKFTLVGKVAMVCAPVYLRSTRHHGVRDLLVKVKGKDDGQPQAQGEGAGEGSAPRYVVVAFDGKCFPKSLGDKEAKVEKSDTVLFVEPEAAPAPAPVPTLAEPVTTAENATPATAPASAPATPAATSANPVAPAK